MSASSIKQNWFIDSCDTKGCRLEYREGNSMKPSVLTGIIQRLEAMTNTDNETEVRRFEVDGVEKCQVAYITESDSFEMTESATGTVFRFDDIDLVAFEIFDLLG